MGEIWQKSGWRNNIRNLNELKYNGCSAATFCFYEIRECCLAKDVENCGLCNYYPCSRITKVFEMTNQYTEKCQNIFSKALFNILKEAFFLKIAN